MLSRTTSRFHFPANLQRPDEFSVANLPAGERFSSSVRLELRPIFSQTYSRKAPVTRRTLVLFALFVIIQSSFPLEAARRRLAVRLPGAIPEPIVVHDDFRFGPLGWEAGFADYSPVNGDMELLAEMRALPPEIAPSGTAFYMQGHNRSDDLF